MKMHPVYYEDKLDAMFVFEDSANEWRDEHAKGDARVGDAVEVAIVPPVRASKDIAVEIADMVITASSGWGNGMTAAYQARVNEYRAAKLREAKP